MKYRSTFCLPEPTEELELFYIYVYIYVYVYKQPWRTLTRSENRLFREISDFWVIGISQFACMGTIDEYSLVNTRFGFTYLSRHIKHIQVHKRTHTHALNKFTPSFGAQIKSNIISCTNQIPMQLFFCLNLSLKHLVWLVGC